MSVNGDTGWRDRRTGPSLQERAIRQVAAAKSVKELRQAQAVLLPLLFGLSCRETAKAIGVSPGWASRLKTQFMNGQLAGDPSRPKPGGRRRFNMPVEEEKQLLTELFASGLLPPSAREIKTTLETRLGRSVAMSSVYNLLKRHGYQAGRGSEHVVSAEENLDGILLSLVLELKESFGDD